MPINLLINKLIDIVGKDNVITQKEDLEPYSHDETLGLKQLPQLVIKPGSTKEISQIMKLANRERVAITPRGGGTGLSGGTVPSPGGIVMSFERMNKIKEIDTDNLMAVVEPGVITAVLADEAKKYDLFYPPDPSSLDSCTIGGNVAECAGGARTIKYGTTKNYVTGLEAVLPNGAVIRCGGKLVKNVTGYNLIDLLIGSEGTLGIVTEVTLRLLHLPRLKVDLFIPYQDIESATKTTREILRHKIIPSTIEFMEQEGIEASEHYLGKKLPFKGEKGVCSLLIEIDGERKEELDKEYDELGEIALKNGAIDVLVAVSKSEQDRLWEVRRAISDALESKISEDVVVPRDQITTLLKKIKDLEKKYSLKILSFGHLGDGNVHVNILKGETENRKWESVLPRLIRELLEIVVNLGGMISGEHGIGLAKKPYLGIALSNSQIELMKQIKKAVDPNNILNPGKIFDI